MSEYVVTKRRMIEARWNAVVTRADGAPIEDTPKLSVTLDGKPVLGVSLKAGENGTWEMIVPVPAEAVSDGIRTVLIADSETEETLAGFSLLSGEALDEDLRAEVELMRQELDMLKRAFRRHCVETS
ncbi:hypothetical protein [Lentibacter sp. XHP0401]|uniref:hypothetical protein n=1 Tax=Lentibacter sp. XHP0401 TaxID=2984334 RepID=UPI0021E99B8B|nr:hypothetical protein [Lentibacter sp. XHP0401]MCV2893488.1 hypothetical protein [Lentibacter sp. XHP0401]